MARDVSCEVAAAAVPAVVRLRLALEAGTLAVIGEHAIGLELEQVTGDQVLGVLEGPAREADGAQGKRPRPDHVRCADPRWPDPGEQRKPQQRQRACPEPELDGTATREWH
jgi:hypothetical protein